jgi:uncharacterized integral membrane protein (TIGR00698 family)
MLDLLFSRLPVIALTLGILLGLAGLWPAAWRAFSKNASRLLMQTSIVLLGFWISLAQVIKAGQAGLAFSTGTIVLAVIVSWALGRWLRTEGQTSTLLTAGTAICGGSAIAATGSAIRASAPIMAACTGVVFLLNAAGVYAYPFLGRLLGLTDAQYGAWCAVGVHDVAGVVAASRAFSEAALADATVIKLTRVLWIVPVALLLRWWYLRNLTDAQRQEQGSAKSPFPWFILVFVIACATRAVLDRAGLAPQAASAGHWAKTIATVLLSCALLLIGSSISVATLKTMGWRPLVHGVILWLIVSAAALIAARALL